MRRRADERRQGGRGAGERKNLPTKLRRIQLAKERQVGADKGAISPFVVPGKRLYLQRGQAAEVAGEALREGGG